MAMEMEAGEHTAMADGETTPALGPFEGSVILGDMEAMVTVDPAAPGENTITIMFMDAAEPPSEVSVAASLPSEKIGPLDFTAEPDPAEPQVLVIEGASLSIAGDVPGVPHRGSDGRVRPPDRDRQRTHPRGLEKCYAGCSSVSP